MDVPPVKPRQRNCRAPERRKCSDIILCEYTIVVYVELELTN